MYMSELHALSKLLVIIGALNWGLLGLFNFDLVAALFGKKSPGTRIVYAVVGLAAVYLLIIGEAQRRIRVSQEKGGTSQEQSYTSGQSS